MKGKPDKILLSMRTLAIFFISSGLLASAFFGCSNSLDDSSPLPSSGAGNPVLGPHDTCNNRKPDGYCNAAGARAEDCKCVDCASMALCTSKCTDNGTCDLAGGEDCSCADCFFKVKECSANSVGCDDNQDEAAGCSYFSDDCTCSVCASDARCATGCDNNGSCVPYFEPCSCADCANDEACGGSGTTSASSSSTGGASSSSSSSGASSSSSSGGGGMGGAGGAGGAGGN